MSRPLIESLTVSGTTITVRADAEFAKRYLRGEFFVEYQSGLDLSVLSESVLVMPFLLNVYPVVLLSGEDFTIPELDADLETSLSTVRSTMQDMYPNLDFTGTLTPDRLTNDRLASGNGVAVLYSGGVDSVFTALAHLDAPQHLITVWGNDIDLDNERGWTRVTGETTEFAAGYGAATSFVRTNFREFLNTAYLNHVSGEIADWWGFVQHGLGFIGLAAPIASVHGLDRILIASTHTEAFESPWGSSPEVDSVVTWSGTTVEHDGFETSRQGKIGGIVRHYGTDDKPAAGLRVCYAKPRGDGGNCCECEKCVRTACGLLVERQTLREWGFDVDDDALIDRAISGYSDGTLRMGEIEVFQCQDLVNRSREIAEPRHPALAAWLHSFDFEAAREANQLRPTLTQRARSLLSSNPTLYNFAKRIARRVR